MSDKSKSIYFGIFAVVYLGYTLLFTGHGLHLTNLGITLFVLALAGYYYVKSRN